MDALTIEKRYRVELGSFERFQFYMVGCGGTGSFLALHLARLAYHARQRRGLDLRMFFVDPDVVEDKNIGRQNFCPAEVGLNKAWALMNRYNRAFGLDILADAEAVDPRRARELLHSAKSATGTVSLLIGCVDNAAARQAMLEIAGGPGRVWWLDCGNHHAAGQVLLGNRADLQAPEISPLQFCSGLPLPTVQHPELLEPEAPAPAPASCADLALADVQSLMINQAVATQAAAYAYRLLLARDLDIYATYVDLVTGSARSLGIVGPS